MIQLIPRWMPGALVGAFLVLPSVAAACSCERSSDGGTVSPRADLAFVGRVRDIRRVHLEATPSWEGDSGTYFKVCSVVDRAIAPSSMTSVCVRTGLGGGDCGFKFELGRRYKVSARFVPGSLLAPETGIWDDTAPLP